jgi:histidinol-phosphate/aromatic aminotransferase/cobyric acid decarboxylase-like protein
MDAERLAGLLLPRGYLVRAGTEYGLPEHVRITIGPEPQMRGVVAAMAAVREELAA